MYARSTTVHGNPAAIDVGIAYVQEAVIPAVRDMDGCVGLSMLVDRESGHCIITTAWADADAMHRSAPNVRGIRDRTAEILCGNTETVEQRLDEGNHVAVAVGRRQVNGVAKIDAGEIG